MAFAAILLGLVLQSSPTSPRVDAPHTQAEQVDFSTEGDVQVNITLPPEIRKALEQDQFVRETLEASSPAPSSIPAGWTECALIHLSSAAERDYIVIGQEDLAGAHATHFWIYRETPQGVKLVLFALADGLSIQRRKSNGLREILTSSFTAVSITDTKFYFNGTKYVRSSRRRTVRCAVPCD